MDNDVDFLLEIVDEETAKNFCQLTSISDNTILSLEIMNIEVYLKRAFKSAQMEIFRESIFLKVNSLLYKLNCLFKKSLKDVSVGAMLSLINEAHNIEKECLKLFRETLSEEDQMENSFEHNIIVSKIYLYFIALDTLARKMEGYGYQRCVHLMEFSDNIFETYSKDSDTDLQGMLGTFEKIKENSYQLLKK